MTAEQTPNAQGEKQTNTKLMLVNVVDVFYFNCIVPGSINIGY